MAHTDQGIVDDSALGHGKPGQAEGVDEVVGKQFAAEGSVVSGPGLSWSSRCPRVRHLRQV